MKNIVLHGMRGTGKTSVGKLLAQKLGYKFYDLDECIGELINGKITEYIDKCGWDAFRNREYEALIEVLNKQEDKVLSLGGGAITFIRNQEILSKKADKLIYIKSDLDIIAARIAKDEQTQDKRNSLTGKGTLEELEEIYDKRKEVYEKENDFIVTNNGDINSTLVQILNKLYIGDVCVPIVNYQADVLLETIGKINNIPQIKYLEMRIDFLSDLTRLEGIIKSINKKVIVTNRHHSEGGKFLGNFEQSIDMLANTVEYGADYIDIELQAGEFISKLKTKIKDNAKLIISYHDFAHTPDLDSLKNILNRMSEYQPDVYKIAVMPNSEKDLKIIYELVEYFKTAHSKKDFIFISMGDIGMETRYEIPKKGGLLSFASFDTNKSAPGQIDYEKLHSLINN